VQSGDIFQLVLSQRYERRTFATPFEVYRALRVVNPSPYMVYMQARGCIIVSSSPEILCRCGAKAHACCLRASWGGGAAAAAWRLPCLTNMSSASRFLLHTSLVVQLHLTVWSSSPTAFSD
jgi:hypothetical protein